MYVLDSIDMLLIEAVAKFGDASSDLKRERYTMRTDNAL
jgi:hypothetical protein